MERNIFEGLARVSVPDLHILNLLQTIYLGKFKHMIDWIQGFLKRDSQQEAFNNSWKTLP